MELHLTTELRDICMAQNCLTLTKIEFTMLGIRSKIIVQEKKQEKATFKERARERKKISQNCQGEAE